VTEPGGAPGGPVREIAEPAGGPQRAGASADAVQSPGVLHVHSTFSWDGHGEVATIAAAARSTGLEWIGMTDHDSLDARYAGFEGYRDGVHVIVGYEWTPHGGDHALVYGDADQVPDTLANTTPPGEAIRILTSAGAMAFLAHPDEGHEPARRLPPLAWHDWTVRGFTGLELWNYMSEWAEHMTRFNALPHALWPARLMRGPTSGALDWWDRLNRPTPDGAFEGGPTMTIGVSGSDAHGEGIRVMGRHVSVFPYARVFRAYTNVLLLGAPLPADAGTARAAILGAIRDGHLYFADRTRGDPLGTSFSAIVAGVHVGIGGRAALGAPGTAELRLTLPETSEIRLLRDGTLAASATGRTLTVADSGPGAYRVEAWRGGRAWLFTNPIVLAP
jgi:hypothetical protein